MKLPEYCGCHPKIDRLGMPRIDRADCRYPALEAERDALREQMARQSMLLNEEINALRAELAEVREDANDSRDSKVRQALGRVKAMDEVIALRRQLQAQSEELRGVRERLQHYDSIHDCESLHGGLCTCNLQRGISPDELPSS